MHYKKNCPVLFTVFLILLIGCASTSGISGKAQQASTLSQILGQGELVLGTSGDMPPLNMKTKGGKVIGYEIDLTRLMAQAMGVELKVKTMPFPELLPALRSGKVDMVVSGMTITPKRNLDVAFVGPYLVAGKCILSKEQTLAKADEPSDINNTNIKLVALKDSTSQTFAQRLIPDAELVVTDNFEDAIQKVLTDEVDALIADYPVCVVSLLRYPQQGLVSVLSLLTEEPLGVAIAANPLYMNWVGNFLKALEASGQMEQLRARWFEDGSWLSDLP